MRVIHSPSSRRVTRRVHKKCRPTNEYVRDFLPTLDAVRQANGVHLVYATGTDYAMV
jgi:hypothetical protein